MFEDIHADFSEKTTTFDMHPHLNNKWISIHPCRHAEMMKRMIDLMKDEGKTPDVSLYLYLFLKFISSVIPTIEYDFTVNWSIN
jgi:ubiquitin-like-conjugating enzyme ATG3